MERDPAAVLQAAIRGVVDKLPEAVKEDRSGAPSDFQPAKFFVGHRAGFYFSTGPNGTGYYLDEKSSDAKPAAAVQPVKKTLNADELLKQAEEEAGDDAVQLVDAKSLKRLVGSFEKKYKENLEMRMKYAEQPEKFMESEVDLDEEVQKLLVVAGSPELYPEFVKLGAVEHLMALLSHENTDIAADVIDLFQQLTDADVVEDSEEEAAALVESMIEHNGIELLVHRLTSLTESASDEEGKAVFNTLSIFENMIEVKPEVAEMVLDRSKLLKWMLARLRPREFDSNKQYTAELLAILLQSSTKNQQRLADANGIDVLLQAIAPYKNRDPNSIDEEECLENLFNSLCACLMSSDTRDLFLKAEGVELMLLILKQKRVARAGALKALDFAITRSPANCERFVDQFGLKTIFAIFMGKAKVKRRKGEDASEAEDEERALSVIATLFQNLARGSRRDRLAAKFVENEFEKCDRLMELYMRYHSRVAAAEADAAQNGEELSEEERLLARMDVGLYSLQQCALIAGHLWFVGDIGVRKRILQLLHQKGLTLADVRGVLREFLATIGDESAAAEAERERSRVRRLLAALGQEEDEAAAEAAAAEPAAAVQPSPEGNGMAALPADEKVVEPPAAEAEASGARDVEEHKPAKHSSHADKEEPQQRAGGEKRSVDDSSRSGRTEESERRRHRDRPREERERPREDRDRDRPREDRDRDRHRDKRRKHEERSRR